MTKEFHTISSIVVENEATWRDSIFLTFDIDWAHDDVLLDTVCLVENAGVPATWFVTHDTPVLRRLRSNPLFELGIHPNFNFLLEGDGRNGCTAKEVIDRLLDIVPDACSVRSHSMTQSTGLLQLFKDAGLTHDVNHFIPLCAGMHIRPWRLWNGMTRVPYCWEDDVTCSYHDQDIDMLGIDVAPRFDGLRVFDFHPIHIFLNTETMNRYDQTRSMHHFPAELIAYRNNGEGSRSWLKYLLALEK